MFNKSSLSTSLNKCTVITSGEAGRGCSLASLSVVLLSLSLSEPELLSEPLWLLESSRDCSAPSLLLLLKKRVRRHYSECRTYTCLTCRMHHDLYISVPQLVTRLSGQQTATRLKLRITFRSLHSAHLFFKLIWTWFVIVHFSAVFFQNWEFATRCSTCHW